MTATVGAPHDGYDVPDEHASFLLSMPDGVTVHGSASFQSAVESYFEVVGTEGRIRVDQAFGVEADRTVTLERDGRVTTVENVGGDEIVEEFEYFALSVLSSEPAIADGREGRRDVRLARAVYDAASEGSQIDVR